MRNLSQNLQAAIEKAAGNECECYRKPGNQPV